MNKITFFIVSFFISILTIFVSLFANPENFYGWLIFVVIILFCPLVLYKLCKTIQVTKEQNALLSQIIILWAVLMFAWQNIFPSNNDYMVAITQSVTKANAIQDFLTTPNVRTYMEILPAEGNHPKSYAVSVRNFSLKNNRKLSHKLLNSDLFDESVIINPNIKYTSNRIKLLKRFKNECVNILYGVDGIDWLELSIIPPENINDDNAKIKSITVRYDTKEGANTQKIKKQVENFIKALLKDDATEITIEDIGVNFDAYSLIEKAQGEFEKKNYPKSMEYIRKASVLNDDYVKDLNTIPKIIELERKIKISPSNYQYYINMGDLLSSNIFTTSAYANTEAIKNYEKAIELNSNTNGVYEKIARNYANLRMGYSIESDFSTNAQLRKLKQKSKEKSVEYFLKAIEHSQGNDQVYQSLAYQYYDEKDYNKALEYYNKLDMSKISCKSCINNKKCYANLKTGNIIEAWKATKDCSLWLCKLVRFNFVPDEI